ncbi:hypothetical protein MCEKH37_00945 [Methylophilaceae bacterium]
MVYGCLGPIAGIGLEFKNPLITGSIPISASNKIKLTGTSAFLFIFDVRLVTRRLVLLLSMLIAEV